MSEHTDKRERAAQLALDVARTGLEWHKGGIIGQANIDVIVEALRAFGTPSADATWITCPATGKQCNDFCDPGKGDLCAESG